METNELLTELIKVRDQLKAQMDAIDKEVHANISRGSFNNQALNGQREGLRVGWILIRDTLFNAGVLR